MQNRRGYQLNQLNHGKPKKKYTNKTTRKDGPVKSGLKRQGKRKRQGLNGKIKSDGGCRVRFLLRCITGAAMEMVRGDCL